MVMVNKSTDHKHEPFYQNYAMQAIKDRLLKVKQGFTLGIQHFWGYYLLSD